MVIYNLIDDVAHAGNKDWGGGLTLHMWTCGVTFLALVCQLTGYLVSSQSGIHGAPGPRPNRMVRTDKFS